MHSLEHLRRALRVICSVSPNSADSPSFGCHLELLEDARLTLSATDGLTCSLRAVLDGAQHEAHQLGRDSAFDMTINPHVALDMVSAMRGPQVLVRDNGGHLMMTCGTSRAVLAPVAGHDGTRRVPVPDWLYSLSASEVKEALPGASRVVRDNKAMSHESVAFLPRGDGQIWIQATDGHCIERRRVEATALAAAERCAPWGLRRKPARHLTTIARRIGPVRVGVDDSQPGRIIVSARHESLAVTATLAATPRPPVDLISQVIPALDVNSVACCDRAQLAASMASAADVHKVGNRSASLATRWRARCRCVIHSGRLTIDSEGPSGTWRGPVESHGWGSAACDINPALASRSLKSCRGEHVLVAASKSGHLVVADDRLLCVIAPYQ